MSLTHNEQPEDSRKYEPVNREMGRSDLLDHPHEQNNYHIGHHERNHEANGEIPDRIIREIAVGIQQFIARGRTHNRNRDEEGEIRRSLVADPAEHPPEMVEPERENPGQSTEMI